MKNRGKPTQLYETESIRDCHPMWEEGMGVQFMWKWEKDDDCDYVRVMVFDGERPDKGVEVCRLVPGKTDDRTGCVLRAMNVCDALRLLATVPVDRP